MESEKDYCWQLFVWDETGAELKAEAAFSTGFLCGELSAWHGARWIGPDESALAAETVPVFRLQFAMQIAPGVTISDAARRLNMKREELEMYLEDADAVKQDNR